LSLKPKEGAEGSFSSRILSTTETPGAGAGGDVKFEPLETSSESVEGSLVDLEPTFENGASSTSTARNFYKGGERDSTT
jgi:hypothetical protein